MFGLSITSSWGHGHATTYRGLVRALVERGHTVLFLERDVPCYAAQRDVPALELDIGHVAAFAAVAALRARQQCRLKLPIRDGMIHLPALGQVTVPALSSERATFDSSAFPVLVAR